MRTTKAKDRGRKKGEVPLKDDDDYNSRRKGDTKKKRQKMKNERKDQRKKDKHGYVVMIKR